MKSRGELRLGDEILFVEPLENPAAAAASERLSRGFVRSFHNDGATVTCSYRGHPGWV